MSRCLRKIRIGPAIRLPSFDDRCFRVDC
jgi:hypothetical protein